MTKSNGKGRKLLVQYACAEVLAVRGGSSRELLHRNNIEMALRLVLNAAFRRFRKRFRQLGRCPVSTS